MIGGISSPGRKAGFTKPLFEIEYGQHGMKTRLKSKTGSWPPESYADRFMESRSSVIRRLGD
jgi:hypothetical protein